MSRDIGKAVWQAWGGSLRWGIIESVSRKDRWKYYNINWIDDEAFKRAGGKHRAFRSKGQKELINQVRKFAKQTKGANNEK